MADSTLAEGRAIRDNISMQDDAQRQINSIVSQTTALIAALTTLHTNVVAGDKAEILAMRSDLIARLTAAVAI